MKRKNASPTTSALVPSITGDYRASALFVQVYRSSILDRYLQQVDSLNILKARARLTLRRLRQVQQPG